VFFFMRDAGVHVSRAKEIIHELLSGGPVSVLGWRPVPTRDGVLPPEAAAVRPLIEQLLLRVHDGVDTAEVERWLYRRRLELRHRFTTEQLDVYIPSLSARLVSYKGLLTSFHLADFYLDLSDPSFESG